MVQLSSNNLLKVNSPIQNQLSPRMIQSQIDAYKAYNTNTPYGNKSFRNGKASTHSLKPINRKMRNLLQNQVSISNSKHNSTNIQLPRINYGDDTLPSKPLIFDELDPVKEYFNEE